MYVKQCSRCCSRMVVRKTKVVWTRGCSRSLCFMLETCSQQTDILICDVILGSAERLPVWVLTCLKQNSWEAPLGRWHLSRYGVIVGRENSRAYVTSGVLRSQARARVIPHPGCWIWAWGGQLQVEDGQLPGRWLPRVVSSLFCPDISPFPIPAPHCSGTRRFVFT